ncbi:MAG: extracellular solute-binding protein [Bacillota bacterium]
MKKVLAMILASTMCVSLAACGGSSSSADSGSTAETPAPATAEEAPAEEAPAEAEPTADGVEITLWTYPIGSWGGTEPTAEAMIDVFEAQYPDITVKVQYLDYASGDDQVMSAMTGGTTPDVIMEGPERLVSNWGAAGKMVDLSDLWTAEVTADIEAVSPNVVEACQSPDGAFYEYPLCMTVHTMAINYEVFEAADALQFMDVENRTWTTDGFFSAIEAVKNAGQVITPGIVYCGGQGGDQGTRALVNNLYSGTYTNATFTEYTANSAENVRALEALNTAVAAGHLTADASFAAAEELQAFANQTAAMSFCWNASNAASYASQVTFTPYAMAFPTDNGTPELCGGIWGFGIFDNGDAAKIEAAKTFLQFMADDATQGPDSVRATGFFPVRASQGDVYVGTDKAENMEPYVQLMPYLGSYYNVIGNWTAQRTGWFNLLQQVFSGEDVQGAADTFVAEANAGI